MLFKNNGESRKIRIGDLNSCVWEKISHGEVRDLPEEVGLGYGFDEIKTTEGQLGNKKVETKQIETDRQTDDSFLKELQKINGIGKKTAKDIVKHFPTKTYLIANLNNLGLRDDIELKLREKYE